MPIAALELTRLSYRQNRHAPLHDISLSVQTGECVALLGPAGSGKTTLMRLVSGFLKADEGLVTHDGALIDGTPAHRRGFGVVLQPDALFPHLTLAQNVALPLRLRRVSRRSRAALLETALDLAELSDAASLRPNQATPSLRRRALLARAAVCGPRILLLDDPFGLQDLAGREAMRGAIRRTHKMLGATVLMATREAGEALALADRVAVLDAGRITQIASPEELQERPRSAAVAAMLGESNLLEGSVAAMEDDIVAVRLSCGPLAYARSAGTVFPDKRCVLAIDPSRIAVAPVSAADMGGWALDATMIEAQFMGDTWRLRLLLGSGAELIVRRPAAAGLRGLQPGNSVAIAWQPYHATAFPPELIEATRVPTRHWLPSPQPGT